MAVTSLRISAMTSAAPRAASVTRAPARNDFLRKSRSRSSRSAPSLDTCPAILDHETPAWRRAETLGSIQEQVGRRLATGDHRR
jgi:hypothetical protein